MIYFLYYNIQALSFQHIISINEIFYIFFVVNVYNLLWFLCVQQSQFGLTEFKVHNNYSMLVTLYWAALLQSNCGVQQQPSNPVILTSIIYSIHFNSSSNISCQYMPFCPHILMLHQITKGEHFHWMIAWSQVPSVPLILVMPGGMLSKHQTPPSILLSQIASCTDCHKLASLEQMLTLECKIFIRGKNTCERKEEGSGTWQRNMSNRDERLKLWPAWQGNSRAKMATRITPCQQNGWDLLPCSCIEYQLFGTGRSLQQMPADSCSPQPLGSCTANPFLERNRGSTLHRGHWSSSDVGSQLDWWEQKPHLSGLRRVVSYRKLGHMVYFEG